MNSLKNERGLTLFEVVISVGLIGIVFTLFSSLIMQNQKIISFNQKREEAQFVREDIKEWMMYRAQTQDLANLNQFVLNDMEQPNLTAAEISRRNYLILDNSGIQKNDSNQIIYGEIETAEELEIQGSLEKINRGELIKKVNYWSNEADFDGTELPKSLQTDDNKKYMGQYISQEDNRYLVLAKVNRNSSNIEDYNTYRDGIDVNLEIYDQKTGALLTETVFNWIVDY